MSCATHCGGSGTTASNLGPLLPGSGLRKRCGVSGAECDTIHYAHAKEPRSGEVTRYGDVQFVIHGTAPPEVLANTIDAASFRYAFEAGTVAPVEDNGGIGEMVGFNGKAYVRSTHAGEEYYKTISGAYVRSPSAGFVTPADAVPDLVATTNHGGMAWSSAMNDVIHHVQELCSCPAAAFGGIVAFDQLVATAVAKSTTAKEHIFEHKEEYYPFAPSVRRGKSVRCVVVGFVADVDSSLAKGIQHLDKVLYKGASGAAGAGAPSSVALHTHLVTLRAGCTAATPQDVQPQDVEDCFHLDASSIVASFKLEVWAISKSLNEHPIVSMESMKIQPSLFVSQPCKCSEWIANALADAGVTHVYGGHGGALAPMVNAVCKNPKLQWVVTRNEASASLMAAAHSKLTGTLGCCIATSGPGASNLTTGLLDANLDQCPVIAITGLKPRGGIGYSEFQDLEQSRMFQAGGLMFSRDVADPSALGPLLRDAVAKALTLRCCVHLGVPVDVQDAESTIPIKPFCAAEALNSLNFPVADDFTFDNIATEVEVARMRGGGRIIIAVGHRCVQAGPKILELAEAINAPVLTRLDAKGCCDESHPLVFGVIGVHGKPGLELAATLVESAQLVLSFGNHDDTIMLCNKAGLQIRPMVRFEPDAAAAIASARYRGETVIGDPSWAIDQLLKRLDKSPTAAGTRKNSFMEEWSASLTSSGVDTAPHRGRTLAETETEHMGPTSTDQPLATAVEGLELWNRIISGSWRSIATCKSKRSHRFDVVHGDDHQHCHPAKVLLHMSRSMGPNDVLCVDTGDVTLWASLCACLTKGQRTLSSERLGTMGYSLCAGIVTCLVRKETGRAVVVAGDSGIQMTINELGTVKQLFAKPEHAQSSLIVIVFDNEMLGRVRYGFEGSLGTEMGPSPDFVALAKAYGGDGERLQDPDRLAEVMTKAFSSAGLFIIHVIVDPEVKADMATFHDASILLMNSG